MAIRHAGEMCRLKDAAIRGGEGRVTQTGVTPVTMEVGSFIAITIVGKLNSPSKNYFGNVVQELAS